MSAYCAGHAMNTVVRNSGNRYDEEHSAQWFPCIIRILQNLSIGIAVAGNDINVFQLMLLKVDFYPSERTRLAVLAMVSSPILSVYNTLRLWISNSAISAGDTIE